MQADPQHCCLYNVYDILGKLTFKEVSLEREVSEVEARSWSLNNYLVTNFQSEESFKYFRITIEITHDCSVTLFSSSGWVAAASSAISTIIKWLLSSCCFKLVWTTFQLTTLVSSLFLVFWMAQRRLSCFFFSTNWVLKEDSELDSVSKKVKVVRGAGWDLRMCQNCVSGC